MIYLCILVALVCFVLDLYHTDLAQLVSDRLGSRFVRCAETVDGAGFRGHYARQRLPYDARLRTSQPGAPRRHPHAPLPLQASTARSWLGPTPGGGAMECSGTWFIFAW